MYNSYLNDYGTSKNIPAEQMRSFIYYCMPAGYLDSSKYNGIRQNHGVLHFDEDDGKVMTTGA